MAVCPAEAISKSITPTGDYMVAVDRDKCIGCHRCVVACPFGAMDFFKGSRATKCDLCGGSPRCVEFCFYDCLQLVELSEEAEKKRAKKINALYGKACKDIARREPHERRLTFSFDASKVIQPPA
jgi:Fe-S-cluster-containing hydrogenase component 2